MNILRTVLLVTILWIIFVAPIAGQADSIAKYDFVYLDTSLAYAKYDIRYRGHDNFLGRPVLGYSAPRVVMTAAAAKALANAEADLYKKGYILMIYDSYRPQRAVDDFRAWAKLPADTLTRSTYYPEHDKRFLFQLGYISTRSGHSRGSTIDLSISHSDTGELVDMGGAYDYFGELSHHDYPHISDTQKANRLLLKQTMYRAGFRSYSKEWWHYTLNGEPYPDTYFDFVVEE